MTDVWTMAAKTSPRGTGLSSSIRQRQGHPGPVRPGAPIVAPQEGALIPCAVDSFGWVSPRPVVVHRSLGEALRLEDLPRAGQRVGFANSIRLQIGKSTAGAEFVYPTGSHVPEGDT